MQCGTLHAPTNGVITCTSGNDYNSLCRFMCVEGYDMKGSSSRVCQKDGTYSGIQPSCKRKICSLLLLCLPYFYFSVTTCEDIGSIRFGTIRCIDGNRYNSVCSYSCDSGYEITGASSRKCLTSGKWSDTPPTCQSRFLFCVSDGWIIQFV